MRGALPGASISVASEPRAVATGSYAQLSINTYFGSCCLIRSLPLAVLTLFVATRIFNYTRRRPYQQSVEGLDFHPEFSSVNVLRLMVSFPQIYSHDYVLFRTDQFLLGTLTCQRSPDKTNPRKEGSRSLIQNEIQLPTAQCQILHVEKIPAHLANRATLLAICHSPRTKGLTTLRVVRIKAQSRWQNPSS